MLSTHAFIDGAPEVEWPDAPPYRAGEAWEAQERRRTQIVRTFTADEWLAFRSATFRNLGKSVAQAYQDNAILELLARWWNESQRGI